MTPGTRLGPYEILGPIGAGGMGEVYKARDTRLGREVAVKISAEQFSERFEREARAVAALNHPNICTLHDVGPNYLVMEYIEGPTLAERIRGGAIPPAEGLAIARQIAEALEAAHEKGIVHRDLKPGNVKVKPDGTVKVLDFGLAKAFEGESTSRDSANSPTLTLAATRAGVILGTAAYMSPEQARGVVVDKRADIWAFGVVLFEMLTGRQTFAGETVSDTMAAVLRAEIDWSALPAATPAPIRRLLRRSLERERRKRLRDIGDARLEIDEALATPAEAATAPARESRKLPWAVTAALGVCLLLALGAWWRATRPVPRPLVRLNLELGPEAVLNGLGSPHAIVSPDGTRVVYTIRGADGKQSLATRALDQSQTTPLAGTEGAHDPFFSPDGQWVGFFAENQLKKILGPGGGAVTLCEAAAPRGASWGDDGNIIAALALTGGLSRVPANGGKPQPATELDPAKKERTHRWPQVLPGSQAVLFISSPSGAHYDDATIEVQSFKTGRRKTLVRGGYFPHYLPGGHLLYMHGGVLFAAPMDLGKLELTGPAVPILEDVMSFPGIGSAQFTFSGSGRFLYTAGKPVVGANSIVWLDSTGKTQTFLTRPGMYVTPRFAPDGRRLALTVSEAGKFEVCVYDWERDRMTRLTFAPGTNMYPVWTPDGRRIAFGELDGGGMYWIHADGSGEPQRLTQSKNRQYPYSFSPDGKRLAFMEESRETGLDIWTLPIDNSDPVNPKPGKPEPFLRTPSAEVTPAFSPDGRWLAYASLESGISEVYVRPFPGPGGKWQISNGGGKEPVWSRDGRELFYASPDNRIMVATYTAKGDSFVADQPRRWSEKPFTYVAGYQNFDLAPDGKRIAALMAPEETREQKAPTQLTVLLNFFDELRRRAPAR